MAQALLGRSRRLTSRSTASRIMSVRSSSGARTAAIRSKVPAGNFTSAFSSKRLILPTRRGVAAGGDSAKASIFRISVIDMVGNISDIPYERNTRAPGETR